MAHDEDLQHLRDYAFKLIAIRPRSVWELQRALHKYVTKRQFSPTLIDTVITDLQTRDYLSDATFVRWWIEQRDSFKPKGDRLLEQELRSKGVSVETIRSVLSQQAGTRENESEAALQIARDRLRRVSSYPPLKQKEKLTRFLLSRGYSWQTVDAVIDSLFQKTYNTNTEE